MEEDNMRRRISALAVVVVLAFLGAVAPSVVAPNANRAEALIRCPASGGVIARSGPYAAWVDMCVEHLGTGVRAMAYVHCYTASGDVACNWEFKNLELWRHPSGPPVLHKQGYAHKTGLANGYVAAQDHGWAPCLGTITGGLWSASSPKIYVRFPNGVLAGPRSQNGLAVVHQDCESQ
jgi:hypothetical protein